MTKRFPVSNEERHAANLLVTLLLQPKVFCPTDNQSPYTPELLLQIGFKNKVQHVLFHFLDCARCKKTISSDFKKTLTSLRLNMWLYTKLYQEERKKLLHMLQQHNLQAMLFKEHTRFLSHTAYSKYFLGSDMDILVPVKDFHELVSLYTKNHYIKKQQIVVKEIEIVNPKTRFEIDIHSLFVYPDYGPLPANARDMIEKFSSDLCRYSQATDGVLTPSLEYFLLSLCMRFWYNDIATGLKGLYEILMICHEQRNTMRWDYFFSLADTYGCKHTCMFILLLGRNLLDISLPEHIYRRFPLRVRLYVHALTLYDVMCFPTVQAWQDKKNQHISRQRYEKYFLLKLVLEKNAKLTRLFRPKIIQLFLISLWNSACLSLSRSKEHVRYVLF